MLINKKTENKCFSIKITATDNGSEVGRVRLYVLHNDLHAEPFGFMEDLFVNEKNRGQGVGKELVEAALEEAKKNKCYKFIFTCSHAELFGWYEKLGFTKHGLSFRMNLKV